MLLFTCVINDITTYIFVYTVLDDGGGEGGERQQGGSRGVGELAGAHLPPRHAGRGRARRRLPR